MAQFMQNLVSTGLVTTTVTVPNANFYNVRGKISLPELAPGGGVSACVAVVNKNGSPVYTGTAGASGFMTQVTCAANDILTIVLSSAAAVDQPVNAIKMTTQVFEGY